MQRGLTTRGGLAAALIGLAVSCVAESASHTAPLQVAAFHGQYCRSMGPRGWAVIAENAQRVGFGADMLSYDGKAAASYSIFGAGALSNVPGYENPDRAVASAVSRMGALQVRYGQRRQLDRNVFEVAYQTQDSQGVAFWQVIPSPGGGYSQGPGYMIVLRMAYVAAGQWPMRGAEASAVARSLRCNVPNVPPAPDPPSLNKRPAEKTNADGEADSEYNVWLDKEYYHNPQSGENFWVSPSQDWQQNGPQGPGYYAPHGNDIIKLQSGYSQ